MTSHSTAGSKNAVAAAEDLWHYAATVYQRPGLKDALLALQDRHGIDVVVLLTCAYLAEKHCRLTSASISELIQANRAIRGDFVLPIRQLRRHCAESGGSEGLYSALKAAELQAERAQMGALAGRFWPWLAQRDKGASVEANICVYWGSVVGAADEPLLSEVAAILQGSPPLAPS